MWFGLLSVGSFALMFCYGHFSRTVFVSFCILQERKWPPHIPKRPARGRGGILRERSLDLQDRQRQEARRRLMAAKRAASFRQNSATERADSIEIYIPEAQTRLWGLQVPPLAPPPPTCSLHIHTHPCCWCSLGCFWAPWGRENV